MSLPVAECYPTRSTLHHECAGARDLADWLAHLRLKNLYGHLDVEDARADLKLLELEV